MKYIVPEYYKYFECKCGNCRHSCCDGWPIRISQKEYYHLLGITCSAKLRSKLDCALKVTPVSGNEVNTQIATDWRGICMLHREDGLCALQTELGENSLPDVCRLYPRHSRHLTEYDTCSCSNSCEAVIELLLNQKKPLMFEEAKLSITPIFEAKQHLGQKERCEYMISILQDRSIPLSERLVALGHNLTVTNTNLTKLDHLSLAFRLMHQLELYFSDSLSIQDYSKSTLSYFCIEDKEELSAIDLDMITKKHITASGLLDTALPDWQRLFEQLLVNHMFYNTFPYNDNQQDENNSFLSLAITYSFLRFNLLGNLSVLATRDKLVDFLSAMFRLIEHSNFRQTATNLYHREKYPLGDGILQLLFL